MDTRHKGEESIFKAALKIQSQNDRTAYLKKACGDDAVLLARVEALLKAYDEADDFLESPPVVNVTPETGQLSEGPGTRIGRYKLLELIGEGGFGVVYMAEQREPIRRRVALKIIKLGMDTKQVIARFEAERQALAMMDHPNIAKVLDAGATETGRPYFVMELVRGIPVTEYCDKNKLDTRQRLELFIEVCRAIQHAHQKGIIHRDIKPTNILVTLRDDDTPVPKVIDFGIAKATQAQLTEKTLFTEFKQFIGTPEYMSPEQARMGELDIDTRSDIYALGVLLYELLTGTTPFDRERLRSSAYDQMLKTIREAEPPKPSTRLNTLGHALTDVARHRHVEPSELCKLLKGDLDWVVMKTLEKDRTRRYESANELAQDIERHLRDEPVVAGPPGVVYRLRKFIRRNRTAVSVGLVILLTLMIGLSLAIAGFMQASRQWNRAEKNFQMARAAVEEMTRVAEKQLVNVSGTEQVRRELLQRAQVFYAGFAKEDRDDPGSLEEIALAYRRLGVIQRELGNFFQADEAFAEAIGLLERLTAEFADVAQYRAELAECWDQRLSKMEMLRPVGQELTAGRRKILLLWEQLVVDFPAVPEYLQQLASAYTELGCSLYDTGLLEEAETRHRKSLAILKELYADFPEEPKDLSVLAHSHHWLISLNLQQGISNSLDAKLGAALNALDDINTNNDGAAVNTIEAFINAVDAQRGKEISEPDADALIQAAVNIINMLSGP